MISVTKLKRCLDRNATWWMGWILASVAIAWLRLYVLANGVFRYSLQYEEGNVYWKVSRFYPWFRALFTPDFNSIPLFYRLSAHFIYNGLGWHDQYPVAIKFTLFAFFSAGVLLLLHPKFTLVPWSARALLVLCFHFCAGPDRRAHV